MLECAGKKLSNPIMESTWKTLYVDLFKGVHDGDFYEHCLKNAKSAVQHKDGAESKRLIQEGKEWFRSQQFEEAMEKYTESLRFALVGSSTLRTADKLRSRCFLRQQALKDFEEYGKLKKVEIEPFLDGPSHKHYPNLSNMVDVKYDTLYGQLIIAIRDIPPGKRLLSEKAFAISHWEDMKRCYTCLRPLEHLIPCEQCVCVVFCDSYCMNRNVTHEYECGTFFNHLRNADELSMRFEWLQTKLAIQTILKAIYIFGGSVEKLMKFVEDTLSEDPDLIPEPPKNATSEYHFFLKLKRFDLTNCSDKVKRAFLYAMELPKICALFDTTEKQRFLMHLVEQHMSIIHANSWENSLENIAEYAMCGFIGSFSLMFHHSCEPNAKYFTVMNNIVIETIRPIQKGEQIFISYLSAKELKQPRPERSEDLEYYWGFICKCIKCKLE